MADPLYPLDRDENLPSSGAYNAIGTTPSSIRTVGDRVRVSYASAAGVSLPSDPLSLFSSPNAQHARRYGTPGNRGISEPEELQGVCVVDHDHLMDES